MAVLTATVSGLRVTTPLRASERAAGLTFLMASSSSLRLCEPGWSSRKARSSRSGLLNLGSVLGRGGEFDAQAFGGGAQGIALGLHVFGDDEALALQGADGLVGEGHGFGEVGGRERALFEHAEDLGDGVVGRGIEEELARGVAAGIGEGPDFAAANFGGEGQHAAQDVAERRAVVAGDPAAEGEQFGAEDGFGIEQAQGVAGGDAGPVVVAAEDDAGEFAGAEGHEDAAAGADAMAQGVGQRIGERLIERDRQTDVAEEVGSLGHGNFRIATDHGMVCLRPD